MNIAELSPSEITQFYDYCQQAKDDQNPSAPLLNSQGKPRTIYFKNDGTTDLEKSPTQLLERIAQSVGESTQSSFDSSLVKYYLGCGSLSKKELVAKGVSEYERLPGEVQRGFALKQLRMFERIADQMKTASGIRCVRLSGKDEAESAGLWFPIFRSDKAKNENNAVCQRFKAAVEAYYANEEGGVPESVKAALAGLGEDGTALSAKRIKTVCNAMRAADRELLKQKTGLDELDEVSLGTLPILNALKAQNKMTSTQCEKVLGKLQEVIQPNSDVSEAGVLEAIGYDKNNVGKTKVLENVHQTDDANVQKKEFFDRFSEVQKHLSFGSKVILKDSWFPTFFSTGADSDVVMPVMFTPYGGDNFKYTIANKNPEESKKALVAHFYQKVWDEENGMPPSMVKNLLYIPVKLHTYNTDLLKDKYDGVFEIMPPGPGNKPTVECSAYNAQTGKCQVKIGTKFMFEKTHPGQMVFNVEIDKYGNWTQKDLTFELDS